MALVYRVCVFGKPRGPWRTSKRQAQQDARELNLGDYDEDGCFYLDGIADLEWLHEDQLRLRA